ncbi:cyclin-like protein [Basidiobolus meristosporus CBS 931.73]|uniref:Cyclin-like protein n=1 Tax=Basidiobolus meristosporus CBS 931.73 TaxID=1314790 RepID=A0A1Y1YEF6_9FUNG|nr:cyclin-like protein [Basidiobolus meristosporus CBS 931.73]|eukprot:ORX96369.1 cyclin-like protein [Basidiobolus meristosporus CBS 931.73]
MELNDWLFTQEDLAHSPTICDGLSWEKEQRLRQKGIDFIVKIGQSLQLFPTTTYIAGLYFHRFYTRQSFRTYHHYDLAGACLYVAIKAEEDFREHCPEEIAKQTCRLFQECTMVSLKTREHPKNDSLDQDVIRWQETIYYHEEILLETLCFDLHLDLPYKYLFEALKRCGASQKHTLLATRIASDFIRTPLCLLYSSKVLAGVAISQSCQLLQNPLIDQQTLKPWREVLGLEPTLIKEATETSNQVTL